MFPYNRPKTEAMVSPMNIASVIGARLINHTPSGKEGNTTVVSSSTVRVLPIPPSSWNTNNHLPCILVRLHQ